MTESTAKPSSKEPIWPVLFGSVVPVATYATMWQLCYYVTHGGGDGELGSGVMLMATLIVAVLLTIYAFNAFILNFFVLLAFGKRGFLRTFLLTLSHRAWALSGFLFTFIGIACLLVKIRLFAWFYIIIPAVFLVCTHYTKQGWYFWPTLAFAGLIGWLLGMAIIELAHKVKATKPLLLSLIVTEILAVVLVPAALHVIYGYYSHYGYYAQTPQRSDAGGAPAGVNALPDEKQADDVMDGRLDVAIYADQKVGLDPTSQPIGRPNLRSRVERSSPFSAAPFSAAQENDPVALPAEITYKNDAYCIIASNWRRTRTGVLLNFVINSDGGVRDVKIKSSSGNDLIDRQAVEAVRNASLPPFPSGMSQTNQIEEVNFDMDANYIRNRRNIR